MSKSEERRLFLSVALASAGAVVLGGAGLAQAAPKDKAPDVTPSEDLMREHGVLRRILLVYEECARRLTAGHPLPADVLQTTAHIVRTFVEDYHERAEETQVFPRLQKAGKEVALVRILLAQHQGGRRLTAAIQESATPKALQDHTRRKTVIDSIAAFSRMYRPHAAREDTVLFPAFRTLFTEAQFDALGEEFEDQEHKLLGSAGFEGTLAQVSQLERTLGIEDLAQFTP